MPQKRRMKTRKEHPVERLIYLLEPNPIKCEQLQHLIKPLKTDLRTYSSWQALLKTFTESPATLVILALDIQQTAECSVTGLDLFLWFKKNHPHTTLILMLENKEPALEQLVQWNGGYVLNYSETRQLYHLLSRISAYQNELRFAFNDITLFDLVQMVCLSQSRRHLYINDTHSADEGLICFQQGRIQHAVWGNATGENALFQLLRAQRGVFGDAADVPDEIYTIASETASLLARSALQQDQHHAPPLNILVIDRHDALATLLQRNYAERLEVLTWSPEKASLQGVSEGYDLVVFNIDAYREHPAALPALLKKAMHHKILWVGSADALGIFDDTIKSTEAPFFLFPMQNQEMLAWFQHQLFDPSFEGELIDLQLFDALQVLGLSNHPRKMECYDAFLGESGELWLGNGQVLHATFGDKEGIEALECWTRLRVGHIFVQESPFPEKTTIQQPITRLLMNMAVIMDQSALIPDTLTLIDQRVLTPDLGVITF
jgi:hypothetical protein